MRSIVTPGNRVRVKIGPVTAEVTSASADRLALAWGGARSPRSRPPARACCRSSYAETAATLLVSVTPISSARAATIVGSNWVPEQRSISPEATSCGSPALR